jgi:hypothetical protein
MISLPRIATLDGEGAEAAQFHTVTTLQGVSDFIEQRVDDALHVAQIEMRIGGRDFLDEFGLDHIARCPIFG